MGEEPKKNSVGKDGGRGRNRTYNQSIKSRMLCQLSYASKVLREAGCVHESRAGRPLAVAFTFKRISQGFDGPVGSADEIDLDARWDDAAIEAHLENPADGLATICSVVDGALVDVHADVTIRQAGV